MDGRQVTVCLASRDLIVNTEAVGRYLAQDSDGRLRTEGWKHSEWKGEGLDILWFDDLDHAQVFDSRRHCEILAKVVKQYSLMGRQGKQGKSYGAAAHQQRSEEM